MLLDIIIPQFNENEEMIEPLLDSILEQQNIDFKEINVTIVNDYSDVILSNEFLLKYELLNICYIRNDKNTGPGLARQKGIDNTDNKYIMFYDADDKLFNNKSLAAIIGFLKEYNPNYLVTNIACEIFVDDKKSLLIKRGRETFPWMHGKVYKRSFLEENKIKFSPNIRHVEDAYFTTCVIGSIDLNTICYLDYITYLWKANSNSLTRKKSKYHYLVDIFDDYFNSPKYIYEFLCERKSNIRFSFFVSSIFGIYAALNSSIFISLDLEERKKKYEEELKNIINQKRNIFILFKREDLQKLFDEELRQLKFRNNIEEVYKTLDDFMNEYIK